MNLRLRVLASAREKIDINFFHATVPGVLYVLTNIRVYIALGSVTSRNGE